MNATLSILQQEFGEARVKADEPISTYASIKIGGPATYYLAVDTIEDLIKAVQLAHTQGLPVLVFGGGTSLLVSEKGFDGLVVKNNCRKIGMIGVKGKMLQGEMHVDSAMITAESGVITNQLVRYVSDEGYSGLEHMLGLPGTIGGAVYMNANYPKENILTSKSVVGGQVITQTGEVKHVDAAYFGFDFDTSSLQRTGDIVLSVTFQLSPLAKELVWARGQEVSTYRIDTQPKGHTTGYTFRNMRIVEQFQEAHRQSMDPIELIKTANLETKQVGGVKLFEANPHYMLNLGTGTTDDIAQLETELKSTLQKQFGVQLHVETHERKQMANG